MSTLTEAQGQEPVAWATQLNKHAHISWGSSRPDYPVPYDIPLYAGPSPAQGMVPAKVAQAWKWGYEYLQDRMRSIGREGWAHDCDGEIQARLAAAQKGEQP